MNGIDHFVQKVKKHGFLPPVIALGGEERALIDEAVAFLRRESLTESSAQLNHQKFIAGEHDLSQIGAMLNIVPFLGKKRVLEIHQSEKLRSNEIATILDYLKNPCSTSLLILMFDKVDKRNKFISSLMDMNLLFVFAINDKNELEKFIINETASHGLIMSNQVASVLALVLNDDLVAIKSAVAKLSLLFKDRAVSIDDIEEHVVTHGEQDVFLLARHISEGRLADALCILAMLRSSKECPIKFLGLLAWQFRTLVHIRHCLDSNLAESDIRKAVVVFGDRFLWMQRVAKKGTLEFHIGRLTRLLECDRALKTLNVADRFNLVEKVVYQSVVGLS